MIALISDIHSNLEALTAVLQDIDSRGAADSIYCLGDIVGYGPDPEACVNLVMERCSMRLMGNHDFALVNGALGFNFIAREAIDWTRERMAPGKRSSAEILRRWHFIEELEQIRQSGDILFVHASPRDHINEYILPSDADFHPDKVTEIFEIVDRVCYVGHTHVPGIMTTEPMFLLPEEVDLEYEFGDEKVIVNLGSVGQPRDGDPRASYVELDEKTVYFRRVEYDYKKTIEKILAEPGLDERCGTRLAFGR